MALSQDDIRRAAERLDHAEKTLDDMFFETRKGDTIQADYGPYGSVSCYFA
jgi:hypothetical protein